jgi:hypothetical protein
MFERDLPYSNALCQEISLSKNIELEMGAIYSGRKFSATHGTTAADFSGRMIHVPAVLHFWASKHWALGIGLYANFSAGDLTTNNSTREHVT